MSDIQRYGEADLELPVPVEWQAVKQAFSERYDTETRVISGGLITERAQVHLARIRARLPENPDQMDMLLVSAFAFGAAENINRFMRGILMRILDYAIAAVVIPIFFLFIGGLIYTGVQELGVTRHRKYHPRGFSCRDPRQCRYRGAPRYGWWERLRAWYYGYQIDRLAADIEKKLERHQRRAELWQRNHRI